MKRIIQRNAEIIRRLHCEVHERAKRRSESPEAMAAWEQACARFHSGYDSLAFPGGLAAGLERLAQGDMAMAETAIAYLELHPISFVPSLMRHGSFAF